MLDHQEYVEERQNTATLTIYEVADLDTGVYKLRSTVHIDSSYEHQSSGKVEVWNPTTLTWNAVGSHHPGAANLRNKRAVAFDAASTLRLLACAVLADDLSVCGID